MKKPPGWAVRGMSIELGRIGFWRHPSELAPDVVDETEALGYGAIWLGDYPGGDLKVVEDILDATDHIAVATGIVNVWKDDAATMAADYHRIAGQASGPLPAGHRHRASRSG